MYNSNNEYTNKVICTNIGNKAEQTNTQTSKKYNEKPIYCTKIEKETTIGKKRRS